MVNRRRFTRHFPLHRVRHPLIPVIALAPTHDYPDKQNALPTDVGRALMLPASESFYTVSERAFVTPEFV
jgi:hypothetical protein